MTAPEIVRTDRRWEALAEKIAPGASRLDLDYLGEICQRTGLSPFTSPPEIVLIGRRDKRAGGRVVYRPQVTIDGRLALAMRSGRIVGLEGPHFTGAREDWTDSHGQRIWTDMWDAKEEGEYPRAARYLVHVAGWTIPVNGTAPWIEFCQRDHDGKLLDLWRQMPTTMLAKTALSLGLRRAGVESLPADVAVGYEGDPGTADISDSEVPEAVYDALPESRGALADEDQPTRYDPPDDDPGRPFTDDPDPGARFVE
jgi:hypothetical protein